MNLERTIKSMEVAEMVSREHKEVLRDIRKIIGQLGESKIAQSFFIESTYINEQNKEQPCFELTKKGCELYSTRMTGAKGTQFAVAYIERFNKMENIMKSEQEKLPSSTREQLRLMFKFQDETAERVDSIEQDITEIKENQLLNEVDYSTIAKMVQRKVNILCTEQHLNNKQKKELFIDLNSGIKRITGVVSRSRIKAKDFDKVVSFINNWQPSTATLTIIQEMKIDV